MGCCHSASSQDQAAADGRGPHARPPDAPLAVEGAPAHHTSLISLTVTLPAAAVDGWGTGRPLYIAQLVGSGPDPGAPAGSRTSSCRLHC